MNLYNILLAAAPLLTDIPLVPQSTPCAKQAYLSFEFGTWHYFLGCSFSSAALPSPLLISPSPHVSPQRYEWPELPG